MMGMLAQLRKHVTVLIITEMELLTKVLLTQQQLYVMKDQMELWVLENAEQESDIVRMDLLVDHVIVKFCQY